MTDRVQVPEEYTTESMTPDEHIVMASAFLHEAQRPIIKRAKHNGADEVLPFVGEDVHVQRHVDTYSRLATLHMQMASTKSLMQSMGSPRPSLQDIDDAIRREREVMLFGEPLDAEEMQKSLRKHMKNYPNAQEFLNKYAPKGTVTGRMHVQGPSPVQDPDNSIDDGS